MAPDLSQEAPIWGKGNFLHCRFLGLKENQLLHLCCLGWPSRLNHRAIVKMLTWQWTKEPGQSHWTFSSCVGQSTRDICLNTNSSWMGSQDPMGPLRLPHSRVFMPGWSPPLYSTCLLTWHQRTGSWYKTEATVGVADAHNPFLFLSPDTRTYNHGNKKEFPSQALKSPISWLVLFSGSSYSYECLYSYQGIWKSCFLIPEPMWNSKAPGAQAMGTGGGAAILAHPEPTRPVQLLLFLTFPSWGLS
jgi:hypothetical protein